MKKILMKKIPIKVIGVLYKVLLFLTLFAPLLFSTASAAGELQISREESMHLIRRTGFGVTEQQIDALMGLDKKAAVERILIDIFSPPVNAIPAWITEAAPPYWATGDMPRDQRRAFRYAREKELAELRLWWVREMIETPRPQTERLVLFWHNHFVSGFQNADEESTSIARQHLLFRSPAARNYRTFLQAIVRDPAMLIYLDNRSSHKKHPNENLAREFLELFTLGVGNYSETDVREAARALTGWSVMPASNNLFDFKYWHHDDTPKTLLGKSEVMDADDLVDAVLEHPAAAEHLVRKFWRFYVSEFVEDDKTIGHIADEFRDSGYDILHLLRTLFLSDAFWDPENRHSIVKAPVDLVIGSVRSTAVYPADWTTFPMLLAKMGQDLFEPPDVAGWPGAQHWITPDRLLNRHRFLAEISDRQADTANVAPYTMVPGAASGMASSSVPSMSPVMTESTRQMNEGGNGMLQARSARLKLRMAAENYQGAPTFKVGLWAEGNLLWESQELQLQTGWDSERYGRFDSRMQLPWELVDIPADWWSKAVAPTQISVEFMNDHAGASGDRNLFVDWVEWEGRRVTASGAVQHSQCPPDDPQYAGTLYCAGTVTITLPEPLTAASVASGLEADQAWTWWIQKKTAKRQRLSATFGLVDLTLSTPDVERHWDSLAFSLVRHRHYGIAVEFSSSECWPTCFLRWPECAWKAEDMSQRRTVAFPLNEKHVNDLKCHWDGLHEQDKRLVGSIINSLDVVFSAVADGDKAGKRADEFAYWQRRWKQLEPDLPVHYQGDWPVLKIEGTAVSPIDDNEQLTSLPLAVGAGSRGSLTTLDDLQTASWQLK